MKFHHQNITSRMDLEAILRTIWPKQAKYRLAGAYLMNAISLNDKKYIDGTGLNKLCDEKNISRATMQKVFVHLRTIGMVERRQAQYYLNVEFATALRRMSDAWKNLKSQSKFDFDEIKLGINI